MVGFTTRELESILKHPKRWNVRKSHIPGLKEEIRERKARNAKNRRKRHHARRGFGSLDMPRIRL